MRGNLFPLLNGSHYLEVSKVLLPEPRLLPDSQDPFRLEGAANAFQRLKEHRGGRKRTVRWCGMKEALRTVC